MSLSHLADGCRTPEEAGFCQTKRTPERLNVTRLFSRLPLRDPSSSYLKTVSFPFIPVCCFKPPANLFSLLRVLLSSCFRASRNTRDRNPPDSEKGRRKYVISSAHPPKTAVCVDGGAQGARVCVFCMCAGRSVGVPVGDRTSLASV